MVRAYVIEYIDDDGVDRVGSETSRTGELEFCSVRSAEIYMEIFARDDLGAIYTIVEVETETPFSMLTHGRCDCESRDWVWQEDPSKSN